MLELKAIARLEERRQAQGLGEVARESLAVAGGIAGRDTPGSWHNYAVGMALAGPATDDELDAMTGWFTDAGIEPRVEVCPFADPSLVKGLASRGFALHGFEAVFSRELTEDVAAPNGSPAGVELFTINPADDGQAVEYARTVAGNFLPPGQPVSDEMIAIAIRGVRHPRNVSMAARVQGRIIGGGSVELSGEVCGLFGLSVNPEHRRRGIQQALIAARLNLARARGCRIAIISGKPGEGTERNVRRMGFQLAYTKAILTKPGPGLAPMWG